MEQLFEMILANLPVLVFILVGLWGVIKRAAGGDSNKESPQKPRERQRSKPQQPYEPRKQETVRRESIHVEETPSEQTSSIKSYYEELKKKQQELQTVQAKPQVSKPKKRKKREIEGQFGSLSKKRVVEGVMFSEILGEPRSRKPHSAARIYQKKR
ncbi:hypothetical protein LC040_11335 [Bacillus tianshenii]|nr:hypothetical protein LC040_11335 [Bacillus tianshenii]